MPPSLHPGGNSEVFLMQMVMCFKKKKKKSMCLCFIRQFSTKIQLVFTISKIRSLTVDGFLIMFSISCLSTHFCCT